jgi:hypothetical protein
MSTAGNCLRNLAVLHNELPFARMVTAAFNDEEWAIDRLHEAIHKIGELIDLENHTPDQIAAIRLEVIRATDTTSPTGAIARGEVRVLAVSYLSTGSIAIDYQGMQPDVSPTTRPALAIVWRTVGASGGDDRSENSFAARQAGFAMASWRCPGSECQQEYRS